MSDELRLRDRHSRTQSCVPLSVERPTSADEIQRILDREHAEGRRVSAGGRRHAMGGQQFARGLAHIDLTAASAISAFDPDAGLVTAQAGICWRELVHGIVDRQANAPLASQWGIRQKQTGANDLTLGGAISANAHGRGLRMRPMVDDTERLTLLRPNTDPIVCSREQNADLFRSAVGGYGLEGVIADVTLRLAQRRKVRRVVDEAHADELIDRFNERIADGYLYGDFQFDISPRTGAFLTSGVFSCYQPVPDDTPIPEGQRYFTQDAWLRLVELARGDKPNAYREYFEYYKSTDGQLYYSDTHQLSTYTPDYPDLVNARLPEPLRGTEMITELYVARHRLRDFLRAAAHLLRSRATPVTYGTIRLIEPDDQTILPWARRYTAPDGQEQGPACIIFNLLWNEQHATARADDFRALIDLALEHGDTDSPGGFFLTYHRFARRDQLEAAYPDLLGYLERVESSDAGVWSDWAEALLATLRGA